MNFHMRKCWTSWVRGGMAFGLVLGLGFALWASPVQAEVDLYVVEQASAQVLVVKTDSNGFPHTVVATIPVGSIAITARATPDQTAVWVTNGGDNSVTVIRTHDNSVLTTFTVPNLSFPGPFVFSLAGDKAYLTSGDNTIKVVNTQTYALIASIPVGNFPAGIARNSSGTRLYVTNLVDNTVSVIDATCNEVVATIQIPSASVVVTPPTSLPSPTGIAVSPDDRFVYVTNAYDNNLPATTPPFQESSVSVIQTSNNHVVANIPSGGFLANNVAFTLDGRTAYVTNGGTDNYPDNRIGVIQTSTQQLVSTDTETAPMGGPGEVDLNPSGSLAYVPNNGYPGCAPGNGCSTNVGGQSVATINTRTNQIVNYFTLPLGSFPTSIAVVRK